MLQTCHATSIPGGRFVEGHVALRDEQATLAAVMLDIQTNFGHTVRPVVYRMSPFRASWIACIFKVQLAQRLFTPLRWPWLLGWWGTMMADELVVMQYVWDNMVELVQLPHFRCDKNNCDILF